MTQPANTYDSYDMANGIREDLSEIITNVDPDETPLYSRCKKVKVKNTYAEWLEDALRPSGDNKHVEGDDSTGTQRTQAARRGNYTQIFKDVVIVPDTDEGLNKAGRGKEIAYETLKAAKEQKLDIERALFLNNAYVAGNSTTARELAGVPTWLTSNLANGNTASDPTGDGSDARGDGTQEAFTQARFDTVMQSIWNNGGKPNSVYLSSFQMNVALGFTGNNNQRSTIGASDGKVANLLNVYMTPWGNVEFVPSRENRSRDVFIMQDDKWNIGVLRPMKNVALAKTGDATKRQITCELTLISRNEKASGAVYDNLTS